MSQIYCPSCHAPHNAGDQFCGNCGTRMSAVVAQAQPINAPHAYSPSQGPVYSAGVNSPVLAGFWIRFFASFIDGLIVFAAQLLLTSLGFESGSAGVIFSAIYFVGFWTATSTSPGKMMLGLRIEKQDGKPLELGTAMMRYLGTMLSGILLGIGYLMVAFDERKRGLHDVIAKTRVVFKG